MIGRIFAELYKAYGDQYWWSAYTPFEKMIAALLTQHQQINPLDIKRAIAQLKHHHASTPETLSTMLEEQITTWTASYTRKARQIKHYSQWYLKQGGYDVLNRLDMLALRHTLLSFKGMDKETADLILLYAFKRPVFIIDEDMRRIFYRLEFINGDEPHDELRHIMALSLDQDVGLFNEYHALLVQHASKHCRQEAHCDGCPLDSLCPDPDEQ